MYMHNNSILNVEHSISYATIPCFLNNLCFWKLLWVKTIEKSKILFAIITYSQNTKNKFKKKIHFCIWKKNFNRVYVILKIISNHFKSYRYSIFDIFLQPCLVWCYGCKCSVIDNCDCYNQIFLFDNIYLYTPSTYNTASRVYRGSFSPFRRLS